MGFHSRSKLKGFGEYVDDIFHFITLHKSQDWDILE